MQRLLEQLIAARTVPPTLKRNAQRALVSRDPVRMTEIGRSIVNALLTRGELVRVKLQGALNGQGRYFAFRGQSAILDLTPFFTPEPAPPRDEEDSEAEPALEAAAGELRDVTPEFNPLSVIDTRQQVRLINAMESAQRLQIDDIRAGGTANLLEELLAMLESFLSSTRLFVELNQPDDPYHTENRVFLSPEGGRPFWATNRVSGEAIWITDFPELPGFLRHCLEREETGSPEPCGAGSFSSGVAVPLYTPVLDDQDRSELSEAGLLYLLTDQPGDRDDLLRLANRLSRFVTSSWRQRLQMHSLVHTDTLTGVRNRSFFDNQFRLELERARRSDASLVLVLGDIDHFKVVNDRFGHQVGDVALQTVARELLQGLRRIDIVCRIGGEEFALILPDTSLADARDVVSRIQTRIANLRLSVPDTSEPVRLTISFGGVTYPDGGLDHDDLFRRADKMLYLSKEKGRNRCHFWNPDGDPILTLPQLG